jgi:hypothetical protein
VAAIETMALVRRQQKAFVAVAARRSKAARKTGRYVDAGKVFMQLKQVLKDEIKSAK